MKAIFEELGTDDKKARDFFLESLSICAHNHVFSRKLLNRVSATKGPMRAIIPPWLELDELEAYNRGSQGPDWTFYDESERPQNRLVEFAQEYLGKHANHIVVCENFAWERSHLALLPQSPPRLACYGDNDVFHLITSDITDPEQIENSVIDYHHWQTGVCSACDEVPKGDIPDEAFLDEIVQYAKHIFIPAFDGCGYLIWTLAM